MYGSTDRTSEVARKYNKVALIKLERNMGKGRALFEGIKSACGDIVVFILLVACKTPSVREGGYASLAKGMAWWKCFSMAKNKPYSNENIPLYSNTT